MKLIKTALIYTAFFVAVNYGLLLLGNTILVTLFFAIYGEEWGIYATNICIRVLFPLLVIGMTTVVRVTRKEDKRAYLKTMEGKDYDLKEDCNGLLHHRNFWEECVILTILFVAMFFIVDTPSWMFLAAIPVYALYDFRLRTHLHRKWISARLRRD